MLILTRRKDESIVIGNDIEVKILHLTGNQVKIGIQAPKQVEVYRGEIHKQVVEENKLAASKKVDDWFEMFDKKLEK